MTLVTIKDNYSKTQSTLQVLNIHRHLIILYSNILA